ncbi:uncharacterized protein AB9X84_016978 [Acanthopagrus schlegelii]
MCFVFSIDDVIPLAESSRNMAECSHPTEFADCSNLTEFVTLVTRRLMVNIIVAHMREKEGRFVNKTTKEFHALGIVSLFPSLKDPYSKKGYLSLKCNRVVK